MYIKSKVERLFIFIFTKAHSGMTGYFLGLISAEFVRSLLSTK